MIRSFAVMAACLVLAGCQTPPAPEALITPEPEAMRAPSTPAADAPQLARLGDFAVGTVQDRFSLSARVMLTAGGLVSKERNLDVRVWYPAEAAARAKAIDYVHVMRLPGGAALTLSTPGIAVSGAAPVSRTRFPLVVVSHGYGGWSEAMTNLTENIASKGYVVVAIDHQDFPSGENASQQVLFGNVVLNRSRDQRDIIAALAQESVAGAPAYRRQIDAQKVGVIGYSMGGFGALATTGAAYDLASGVFALLPSPAREAILDGDPDVAGRISALVAIAPWGGQPASRAWTSEALKAIRAPVLMIDGDHDDVVDYRTGVRWIFDQLSTTRHLLVFQGARHNVANNPMPHGVGPTFGTIEYLAEPVWRTERLNAINQHFITAFLDLNLKGDSTKAAFLDVPTPVAADGRWVGSQASGATASNEQPDY